ncbi:MAG: hypothetical protein HY892_16450 [Deltaproteobacteria bacterium]|nr:hypothetical protein [Deltaproteobacteria bacterium]
MRCSKLFLLMGIGLLLLTLCSCSGGDSDSGGGGSSADFRFLYDHNAKELDGHTIRWGSNTINVYTRGIPGAETAINRWAGPVNFNFVGSPPGDGISFNVTSSGGFCGITNTFFFTSGRISRAEVTINANQQQCRGGLDNTLTHETAHALGFFGHTSDGTLMDPDGGNGNITSALRNFMSLLYSQPFGRDINSFLSLQRKLGASRYQPNGTELRVRVDY